MNNTILKRQIQYLKDCYTLDNASFTIQNFFDKKYQHQYLIDTPKEELLNQAFPKTFVPDEIGKPLEQILLLNSEDKEVLYCSLFICGVRTSTFTQKLQSIVSPLLYTHASLEKTEGDYFIALKSKPQLNIGFLKTLNFKTNFEQCRLALHQSIQSGLIDFKTIGEIKTILDKHVLDLDTEEIIMYPDLISEKERRICFKPAYLKKQTSFKIVSCSGILTSSKANNTESIDLELSKILESNTYSNAVKAYFGEIDPPEESKHLDYTPPIPMVLNTSQQQVLTNVKIYVNSIIIGPPGTGKSFTITALAMDLIRQGKKVLIATKTDRALDVLENQFLKYNLENRFIKIGGPAYNRKIKKYIRLLTNGYYTKVNQQEYIKIKKQHHKLIKQLSALEFKYKQLTNNTIESSNSILEATNFKLFWQTFYHKHFNFKMGNEISVIETFYKTLHAFVNKAELYFKITLENQLEDTIKAHRSLFMQFLEALKTKDTSLKLDSLQAIDFSIILEAIPLWLTKVKSVSEFLPLQNEMFDVVIFDEATQCDMASCIPILQRGKQVIIAGDTNQLRHFSFLSNTQITNKLEEYQLQMHWHLNYRSHSMLDLMLFTAKHQNQVVALEEHYRSLPAIIAFSNTHFYEEKLNIMTAFPNQSPSLALQHIKLNGTRSSQGVNLIEINRIIELIESIIQKETHLETASTIGVLSPYRQQTEALTQHISDRITTEHIIRHQILIGTPHSFQGSEKDVMLISIAIDNNFHHGSIQYLNKEDMFNVAITRAKTKQIIFHSVDLEKLPKSSLIRQYLEHIKHPIKQSTQIPKALKENTAYKDIKAFLETENWPYYMNHYLAGMTIDILFKSDNVYYAIDLIGFPGEEKEAFTMERYKILNRVGIKVFPLSYITWNFNKDKVTKALKAFVLQTDVLSIYHSHPDPILEF